MTDVREATRQSVDRFPGGVYAVAEAIGERPSRLVRMLKPKDHHGSMKLDVDIFDRIMEVTGDVAPLIALCDSLRERFDGSE